MNCEPFPVRKVVDECRSDREYFELITDRLGTVADKRFNAYTIGSGRDKNEWIVKILHE